jgi:NAD(P)-dependent dehydrogenase (short-subunit alcohol dehydrogenase family)
VFSHARLTYNGRQEGASHEIHRRHRRIHRHRLGLRQGSSIGKGFHVFGSVRKQADAERLRRSSAPAFTPLIFDVTDEAAVAAGREGVAAKLNGQPLFGLVNNAGIANPGPLLHIDIASFRQQMEVNVTGQLIVTQAFAPLLGATPDRKTSHARPHLHDELSRRQGRPRPSSARTAHRNSHLKACRNLCAAN